MSLDPLNPPFPVPGTTTGIATPEPASAASATSAAGSQATALKAENILLEEFNYAVVTAYQTMEDRARIFDRYLLLVGGLIVAGAGAIYQLSQVGARGAIQPLVLAAFAVAGVLGVGFFVSLIRLRQAFRDSLLCMARIKEFYIEQLKDQLPQLEHVIQWRLRTVPKSDRAGNVSWVMCHIVALLDSLCFGVATLLAFEVGQSQNSGNLLALPVGPLPYVVAAAVFLLAALAQVVYYTRALTTRGAKGTPPESGAWVDRMIQ